MIVSTRSVVDGERPAARRTKPVRQPRPSGSAPVLSSEHLGWLIALARRYGWTPALMRSVSAEIGRELRRGTPAQVAIQWATAVCPRREVTREDGR